MSKVTLGGDRLGAGNKQQVELKNYERSTHDLSYTWRSTMSSGTLVPFLNEVGLPGDYFEIDLECDIKTHPTIGPLFGSYKVQLDVFQCPIRLYNGKLHMNLLNVGLNMSQIKLPQLEIDADGTKTGDNEQINPSCILNYLGIKGVARGNSGVVREFNAVPFLSYWSIYKQYYANKQEEIGAYIHNPQNLVQNNITNQEIEFFDINGNNIIVTPTLNTQPFTVGVDGTAFIQFSNFDEPLLNTIVVEYAVNGGITSSPITQLFGTATWDPMTATATFSNPYQVLWNQIDFLRYNYSGGTVINSNKPVIKTFPLSNIDDMHEAILVATTQSTPFTINNLNQAPYGSVFKLGTLGYSKLSSQEGLALKTYQSDLFNNWISTDWIDGPNGINEITAVDTSSGEFTINTLQLSNKVYEMLNRIAVSGGSYDDWLNAVYTHERTRSQENPVYMGGLIKELAFQEVVSNTASDINNNPQALGTLAGRGRMTEKHKGGKIHVKVDEPSYIIGIVSLTPRIDYSQGNIWHSNLKTLDDLHKPALDEIGFQDLITDQMAWWDTEYVNGNLIFNSAGKQPAWLNYMTNVNKCYGNFAESAGNQTSNGGQMFMTLNRRYEQGKNGKIKDLTTYIDPSKFNNIFADERLDAQNFWTQIAVNMKARRKMSAKLMPNL
jgi:hypothetical protein